MLSIRAFGRREYINDDTSVKSFNPAYTTLVLGCTDFTQVFRHSKLGDTCTLPGTMVQFVHVTYDKWGLMPPYPLNCFQVICPTISN